MGARLKTDSLRQKKFACFVELKLRQKFTSLVRYFGSLRNVNWSTRSVSLALQKALDSAVV